MAAMQIRSVSPTNEEEEGESWLPVQKDSKKVSKKAVLRFETLVIESKSFVFDAAADGLLGRQRQGWGGRQASPDCQQQEEVVNQRPCDIAPHTPAYVLQDCPLHKEMRRQIWPSPTALQDKLWGTVTELQRIPDFVTCSGLTI
ncbi:uncharacterized protein LOC143277487 [Babylonia areolata]|uniref:uncharacterized protein LOC143277487 n=1 Tax=Babylonia areolata TaxID=304850 RepID=UPI003FD41524